MRDAKELRSWLDDYIGRGAVFVAKATVREHSYGAHHTPSIHVKVHPTGWELLIEPDPNRAHAWHTIMETSDVDVTLSTSDMAALIQTIRTIYDMCNELERLSYASSRAATNE